VIAAGRADDDIDLARAFADVQRLPSAQGPFPGLDAVS
jgi:hypothetical protein